MIPWKFILGWLLPSIPDIIATVKTLKKEQQQEKVVLDDASMRLYELKKRLDMQLQLIEQLTVQLAKLERAFVWTLWAAIFALVLALIALGITLFR